MSAHRCLSILGAMAVSAMVALSAAPASAQEVRLTAPGASDDLQDRLRSASLLFRDPEEGVVRTGADIIAAARADYGRLIGALYEDGFFAPVITIRLDGRDAAGISPFDPPASVQNVEIIVETGAPFRLAEARIAPLAPDTNLPAGFRSGEPATTPLLRDTTRAALEAWQRQGHAFADVGSQSIRANNRAATLDVAIRVVPGPVITFGQLLPEGQERMRIARIIEIAGLPTGEVYSPEALDRAEERLRDTGVFSAVALTLRDPRGGDISDVRATLDEAPLRRLGFGAELSSDEGVQLSAYWLHRNLLGGAERLRFDAIVSGINADADGIDGELTARFERPATFGPDTDLFIAAGLSYLDEPLFRAEGLTLEAGLVHELTDRLTLRGAVGVERIRFSSALGSATVTRLTLPLGATYDGRDDPLDARSGVYADATLTPFTTLGNGAGARMSFDGRAYRALGEAERTRLAGRLQLGTLVGGSVTDIPPDEFFYAGGSGTVRGHSFQTLGALQNGVPSGGRSFIGLSGEVRHDIGETNFGVVGFADFGAISADAWGQGSSDWLAGAGLGMRYATPFGPIRVDLATPVSGANAGREAFLYIGIGQAF
jgi:translocation and assembly module TamA